MTKTPAAKGKKSAPRRSAFFRHSARFHVAMRILIWTGIVIAVAAGLLALRLSFGPMSVAFLQPYLKDRLSVGGAAVHVDFGDVTLALRRPSFTGRRMAPGLEIRLTDLAVMTSDGGAVARLPEGAVTLSIAALMQGQIAARALELRRLGIATVWKDGELFAALSADDREGAAIREIILRLLLPAKGDGYLRQIRIRDADLVIREAATNALWRIDDLDLDLSRGLADLELAGAGTLHGPGGAMVPLKIGGLYGAETGATQIDLAFETLNPSVLAGSSEMLARFKGFDVAASGAVSLAFNKQSVLTKATADIATKGGNIAIPDYYAVPLAVDRLAARASYESANQTISIEALEASFEGAAVSADGVVWQENDHTAVRLHGSVNNVSFASLPRYWPPSVAPGAYEWISRNITAGKVIKGEFIVDIPILKEGEALPEKALDFQFEFSDLVTHYLRPMPPIIGGAGHAHLTLHDFVVDVRSGVADGVAVAGSRVRLYDFHLPHGAKAHVDGALTGSLPVILKLIDNQPLGYTSKYGIEADHFLGRGVVDLRLDFPLLKTISLADVDFDVKSDVLNLKVDNLFEGVDLSAEKLVLNVDGRGIDGKGGIKLNDTPFNLDWREDFDAADGAPTHYILTGAVEGQDWNVLSLPFANVVDGPVMIRLELMGKGPTIMRGHGAFDLWSAHTGIKTLGWEKDAHKPGLARFSFDRGDDGVLIVRDLVYEDQNLRVSGKITLDGESGPKEIVIDSLKVGETLLAATATQRPDGGYAVGITAESFDARPFLSRLFSAEVSKPKLPDMDLDVIAASVTGLNDVKLQGLEGTSHFTGGQWGQSKASGKFSDGGSVDFVITTPESEADLAAEVRRFAVRSDDAAKVVRVLGLFSDAIGGKLDFSGTMTPPAPGQIINGEIKLNYFRVVRTPVLARILAVGSLTGVSDLLRGDGIRFEHLRAPFELTGGIMRFKNARAWGAAIGITADGKISLTRGDAAFSGSVVPAYMANTILGKLPLVGSLITGGQGQGLFAFTYSITGSLDNPDVSVNPLSVLTPGFLRGIFEGTPKLEEEKEAKEKKK